MKHLFAGALTEISGVPVKADRSYESEGIYQAAAGNCRFIVRPSGTELKLKSYVFAEGASQEEASEAADRILKGLQIWLNEKKEEII